MLNRELPSAWALYEVPWILRWPNHKTINLFCTWILWFIYFCNIRSIYNLYVIYDIYNVYDITTFSIHTFSPTAWPLASCWLYSSHWGLPWPWITWRQWDSQNLKKSIRNRTVGKVFDGWYNLMDLIVDIGVYYIYIYSYTVYRLLLSSLAFDMYTVHFEILSPAVLHNIEVSWEPCTFWWQLPCLIQSWPNNCLNLPCWKIIGFSWDTLFAEDFVSLWLGRWQFLVRKPASKARLWCQKFWRACRYQF